MKKKSFAALLAAVLAVSLLGGCGSGSGKTEGTQAQGKAAAGSGTETGIEKKVKESVVAVLNGEPSGLDPQQTNQINAFTMQAQMFETLVTIDENAQPQPCLAESWEQVDDKTVRFHLRDDVYFHNGEKMTAEDVRYSIERATRMANSANMFSSFDGEKTAVLDEKTVDVVTKEPFAAIYTYLSMSRAGVVCKKAVEEMGDNEANQNPIGTGAFQFVEWQAGSQVTMTRNENYWGEKPAYKDLTFRFVVEAASRAIEVETGNADIAFSPDASDVERLAGSSEVVTVISPAYGAASIYLNGSGSDPVMGDLRVRQAMAYALDIETIAETVYGSLAKAPTGVCPASFTSAAKLDLYEYNPERAKELLNEAGFKEGEAEITFFVYPSSDVQSITEICQNMWTQVGFKVNIVQQDLGAILNSVRAYEGSGYVSAWTYAADDGGFFIGDFDPAYTTNATYAYDDRITELKKEAASCMDSQKRNELYHKAQEILYSENMEVITVAEKNLAYLTTPKVTNFNGSSSGSPYLGNVVVYE